MNTNIHSIPAFEVGEVTLLLGAETGANIPVSIRAGYDIACAGRHGKVLYINTVQTDRKLAATIRETLGADFDGDAEERIHFVGAPIGNLATKAREIQEMVCNQFYKVIIINSWEFANKNYRYREEMIYLLKDLTTTFDITVLVYAQDTKTVEAGVLGRGILGKLAVIADKIIKIPAKKKGIVEGDGDGRRASGFGVPTQSVGTRGTRDGVSLMSLEAFLRMLPDKPPVPGKKDEGGRMKDEKNECVNNDVD